MYAEIKLKSKRPKLNAQIRVKITRSNVEYVNL